MIDEPFDPTRVRVPPEEGLDATAGHVTVSQVTDMVKRAVERGLPSTLHVVGEISNLKRHGSGHLYLTLKDKFSELSCVMWRSSAARMKFTPADGLEVIATGAVEVFARAGRYQLYIRKLEPRGIGALDLAFRQLREKLEAEGLFEQRHKRPLPRYPRQLAVVTSPTGAAIADILRTIERRYPCVSVLVYPVLVQGPGAPEEIARAIERVNSGAAALGEIDLMIVGRGGGSLEDLWSFNEERVARAIFSSRIPIISAVGHEVDVTIADLVADVRAATPTAAAEIAVPALEDVLNAVSERANRLARAMHNGLRLGGAALDGITARGAFRQPLTAAHRRAQVLDLVSQQLGQSLPRRVADHGGRLDRLGRVLGRIAPEAFVLRTMLTVREIEHRLRWVVVQRHAEANAAVAFCAARFARLSPATALRPFSERLERLSFAISVSTRRRIAELKRRVDKERELLDALNYKRVLGRGFSITRTKKGRRLVRSAAEVKDGDRVVTEVAEGSFESEVVNVRQLELFE